MSEAGRELGTRPAFPTPKTGCCDTGMTLRAYIAAHIFGAKIIDDGAYDLAQKLKAESEGVQAESAVFWADVLLDELAKPRGEEPNGEE